MIILSCLILIWFFWSHGAQYNELMNFQFLFDNKNLEKKQQDTVMFYQEITFYSNDSNTVTYKQQIDEYLSSINKTIHRPNNFISTQFNEPIIFLITSCNRWDKLSASIESFEKFNTYKNIQSKYILDDCNDTKGFNEMKNRYGLNTRYKYHFLNNITLPKNSRFKDPGIRALSMIRLFIKYNIDNVQHLKYIFITENDWVFYEYGFIEDSFAVLRGSKYGEKQFNHSKIGNFHLRNSQFSKKINGYPNAGIFDFCGGQQYEDNPIYMSHVLGYNNRIVTYYMKNDTVPCWGGYTNNPHLQSLEQYLEIEAKFHKNQTINSTNKNSLESEGSMSCHYRQLGYDMALSLYNGYEGHIGTGTHTKRDWKRRLQSGFNSKCIPTILLQEHHNKT